VSRLDGMFALAVWDAVNRTLILARDRMGEKPLYYYAGPDAFVFGSSASLLPTRVRRSRRHRPFEHERPACAT